MPLYPGDHVDLDGNGYTEIDLDGKPVGDWQWDDVNGWIFIPVPDNASDAPVYYEPPTYFSPPAYDNMAPASPNIPKTGEEDLTMTIILFAASFAGLSAIAVIGRRKRRKR